MKIIKFYILYNIKLIHILILIYNLNFLVFFNLKLSKLFFFEKITGLV